MCIPAPGSIVTSDEFNVYNKVFSEKHMNLTDYTVNHLSFMSRYSLHNSGVRDYIWDGSLNS